MPTFGEFETFGNPYATSDVRSHVSTIWQARKSGAAGEELYAIKCYAPRKRVPSPSQPDEALAHDRRLEFLEGIKQIKKAQSEGGRGLSPIHALGATPTEAWYVTDFYPRKDLNAWIDRKGEVNGAALRHVVYSVVAACLALKRSRGCSHGNLKPSNIFLAGKPRDLRQTPLLLADAYPAAPLQLARLEPDDRHEAGELLNQVMEVQDLAAIGKLILQLVEGRLLTRADDYNYPVARSREWDALGKDSDYWLEWCNKLLNPQLSLETLNLETLATEFRPSANAAKLRMILAGVGALCLIGALICLAVSAFSASGKRKFQTHLAAATNAFTTAKLVLARNEILLALQYRKADPVATAWKAKITQQVDEQYAAACQLARAALQTNLVAALAWVGEAENLKPKDADARELKAQILSAQKYQAALAEATNAWSRAEAAFKQGQYETAVAQLNAAVSQCTTARNLGDPAAVDRLMAVLDGRRTAVQNLINRNRTLAQKYAFAMTEATNAWNRAEAAFKQGQYQTAMTELRAATDQCVTARTLGDAAAADRLKALLEARQTATRNALDEEARKAQLYATAMTGATNAWLRAEASFKLGQYQTAMTELDAATTQCATARTLGDAAAVDRLRAVLEGRRTAIQTAIDANLTRAQKYATAMTGATNAWNRAEAAFKLGQYQTAVTELDAATKLCTTARPLGDTMAVDRLKAVLEGRQTAIQQVIDSNASKARRYATAMTEATNAWNRAEAAFKLGQCQTAMTELDAAAKLCATARSLGDAGAVDHLKAVLEGRQTAIQQVIDANASKARQYATSMTDATNAWNRAEAAFKQGQYQTAMTELGRATNDCATARTLGDTAAVDRLNTVLRGRQIAIQKVIDENAERAQQYANAMTQATNAWNRAEEALNLGQYLMAIRELGAATNWCAAAQKLENTKVVERLKAVLEARQAGVQQVIDLNASRERQYATAMTEATNAWNRAETALKQKDYDLALTEIDAAFKQCAAARPLGQVAPIDGLEGVLKARQSAAQQAEAAVEAKAREELNAATNNVAALKQKLADPAIARFSTRKWFLGYRDYVDANDPVKRLDRTLNLYKVWFGTRDPSDSIIDPNTGQRAVMLPKTINLSDCYDLVDKLRNAFNAQKALTKERKQDLLNIEKRLNTWQ